MGDTAIEAVHGAIVASNGQVRSSKLTRIGVTTGGTATVLSDLGQMFLITITGSWLGGGVTVNIPQAGDGALVHLVISNRSSPPGTVVVTFGSSVHNTGTLSAASAQMYCVTFFHLDSNNAIEVSRTASLSNPF
jgi:hypothetical protein